MSKQASDWLPESRLASQLVISPEHPDYLELPNIINSAINMIQKHTQLPLVDESWDKTFAFSNYGFAQPFYFGKIPFFQKITKVEYWVDSLEYPPELLMKTENNETIPDIGRTHMERAKGQPYWRKDIWIYPRSTGWPNPATVIKFHYSVGCSPTDYPAISDIAVALARDLFDGRDPNGIPTWQRLLNNFARQGVILP